MKAETATSGEIREAASTLRRALGFPAATIAPSVNTPQKVSIDLHVRIVTSQGFSEKGKEGLLGRSNQVISQEAIAVFRRNARAVHAWLGQNSDHMRRFALDPWNCALEAAPELAEFTRAIDAAWRLGATSAPWPQGVVLRDVHIELARPEARDE